jgi:hypothetical protein
MRPRPEKFSLSILIPLFNEEDNILNLYEQLNRYTSEFQQGKSSLSTTGAQTGPLKPWKHYVPMIQRFITSACPEILAIRTPSRRVLTTAQAMSSSVWTATCSIRRD